MRAWVREAWLTLKETGENWSTDNGSRLAAALAYYSLLSLAPLLIITVAVLGAALGAEAARGQVVSELGIVLGPGAAAAIQSIAVSADSPDAGIVGTVIGFGTLLIGASSLFFELQAALNAIWEVAPKPGTPLRSLIRSRLSSFAMVVCVAVALLVSVIASAVLSAIGGAFVPLLPGGEVLWHGVNFVFSLALATLLFALIFKYVPDATVRWRDVWVGAAATALLFTLGKTLLGLYLGQAAIGSSYGAAGSLIAFVVWVYYAAQILLFGAELTQVMARRSGREIEPGRYSIRVVRSPRAVSA